MPRFGILASGLALTISFALALAEPIGSQPPAEQDFGWNVLHSGKETHITFHRGNKRYMWRLGDANQFNLESSWEGSDQAYYFGRPGPELFMTASDEGARLYRLNSMRSPLLDTNHGLPAHWLDNAGFYGTDNSGEWWLIAIQEKGDQNKNGVPDEWLFYESRLDGPWASIRLPGLKSPVTALRQLSESELAAQSDGVWTLYHRSPVGLWEPLKVADDKTAFVDFRWIEHGNGFGLRDRRNTWTWFLSDATTGRQELGAVFPDASTKLLDVRGLGDSLIGLRLKSGDGQQPAWDYYFFDSASKHWTNVKDLIPGLPQNLAEMKTFADGRGLAVRTYLEQAVEGEEPDWVYYLRGAGSKFEPLQKLMPSLPKKIWSVVGFWGGKGLAVQAYSSKRRDFVWSWFAESQEATWKPVEAQFSIPKDVVRLFADDKGEALIIGAASADGTINWTGYLYEKKRWMSLNSALPQFPNHPNDIRVNWRQGSIHATDTSGKHYLYLRDENGAWLNVSGVLANIAT